MALTMVLKETVALPSPGPTAMRPLHATYGLSRPAAGVARTGTSAHPRLRARSVSAKVVRDRVGHHGLRCWHLDGPLRDGVAADEVFVKDRWTRRAGGA
jgi:hypothetical protein